MAGFFAHRAYRKEAIGQLHAMLLFYPGGVRNLDRNYPALERTIREYCDTGEMTPPRCATRLAAIILANEFFNLDTDSRSRIREQLSQVDLAAFKAALKGKVEAPTELLTGTSLGALAFMMADIALRNGEITEDDFYEFRSEVFGALDGKSVDERSAERIRDTLDETLGPPPLRDGADDTSAVYRSAGAQHELGELNGVECKVRLARTAMGIAMIRLDNGSVINERRNLSQDDLERVPPGQWNECRFVNLRMAGGEICSCLIFGDSSEILGDRRAFWWALAKVNVTITDSRANGIRMSARGLAQVHSSARTMWDAVIARAGSIDDLREEPTYARNVHLEVISQMIEQEAHPAAELGLQICLAMVLATQSEDPQLEAAAYRRFKLYLWRPGEEPRKFYGHDPA